MSHPLPGKLFTFPTFSDTEDSYSTTCDQLLLSDTESVTSSTHQPEDADNYNFLAFQDHVQPISRPSHIPKLKTQMLQPHITNSKHNKDTSTVEKVKPSHIPVPKDKKCHLNPPRDLQTPSSLTAPSKQTTKQQSTLPMQKTTPTTTHSQQTRRTPLLPMAPAPTRKTVTPRPPLYYNRQHHYQQCISGPFRTANNNQCPPLLALPSYHQPMSGNQVPALTRPHPHPQGHLILQVSMYLPVLLSHPNHFVNILHYKHAA